MGTPGIGTGVRDGILGFVGVLGVGARAVSTALRRSDMDCQAGELFAALMPCWMALWDEEPA